MTTLDAPVGQLLLPGQAAAPDGPVDLAPMYLMHRGFRRDLHLFAAATAATPAGDRRRWRRLARRFALFAGILHKHHHGEDVGLWPLLHERGADPAVLDALEAEHEGIDPLLRTCTEDLTALAAGTGDESTRERLAGCTARLRDALCAHLAHEERDGMAEVQRYLTQEDWHRLDVEVFAAEYGPRDMPGVMGWVASGLTREELLRMPTATPALVPIARFFAWRFDRSDARTFGPRS
ncbi:Hemerythrin HHE cation binding domain-containing protein [Geodermatophilus saharensis]|uniref:Hemerythrin HHE cation binding domain-containing protein n=1 Tax=Geodermatophilus saharensis TaxID=1137994 RepID=A0A239IF09_9ACTN|nr:hemerythrin domain-containing protein [Geodermatophilus saharensis]SNS92137.1 Hemerythrin HHE cation binding domain-containing protein [Geodermatophilus saharensis]